MNFNSPTQLSILFFGGTIEEQGLEPVLNELGIPEVYKSGIKKGQIKLKKVSVKKYIKGLGLKPLDEWKTKKNGVYQTNEDVLNVIASYRTLEVGMPENAEQLDAMDRKINAQKIAELMLQIREKEKLLGTYYKGFEKCIHIDSCIHPQFQGVSTDTGRTSCRNPNLQNIPRG